MATISLTDDELRSLQIVMELHYENVVETRQNTDDEEYDQTDEDQANVLVFMLNDWAVDPDTVASMQPLYDAVWIALDTPAGFEDAGVNFDALRSGAAKVGYTNPTPSA
jgi:hypothetical protein